MQGSNCYEKRRENLNLHKTDPPLKPPRWGEGKRRNFVKMSVPVLGGAAAVVSFALILWEGRRVGACMEEEGTFLFKDSHFESPKRAVAVRGFSGI